jgi:hypothetical protein
MTKKNGRDEKKPDDIKRDPFRQKLTVALTATEIAEHAQRAAHLLQDHDARAEEFKEQARENKLTLDRLTSEMRDHARAVREGREFRDVACERVYNWTVGSVQDVRLDTGEVIAERAMTEAERQKSLDFLPPGDGDVDSEFGGEGASEQE